MARLYDWLNDAQRSAKINGARLNAEFDAIYDGIAITPTLASTDYGIAITQSASGVPALVGPDNVAPLNFIRITSDNMAVPVSNGAASLYIEQRYGGAAMTGPRHGLFINAGINSQSSGSNTQRSYSGATILLISTVNETGTLGSEDGSLYGVNPNVKLTSGATHWVNITGGEVTVQAETGSSVLYKSGWQIVAGTGDAVQGGTYDIGLAISAQRAPSSTLGHLHGIAIGNMNGQHPMDTGGTLFGTIGAATVANGIDFSSYTITGNFLNGAGWSVDGAGDMHLNMTNLKNAANDGAAAALGVVVGQVYRNGSVLMVRVA